MEKTVETEIGLFVDLLELLVLELLSDEFAPFGDIVGSVLEQTAFCVFKLEDGFLGLELEVSVDVVGADGDGLVDGTDDGGDGICDSAHGGEDGLCSDARSSHDVMSFERDALGAAKPRCVMMGVGDVFYVLDDRGGSFALGEAPVLGTAARPNYRKILYKNLRDMRCISR
jgi:hypothetical protein